MKPLSASMQLRVDGWRERDPRVAGLSDQAARALAWLSLEQLAEDRLRSRCREAQWKEWPSAAALLARHGAGPETAEAVIAELRAAGLYHPEGLTGYALSVPR
jgi:hypothetical protein